MPEFGAGHQGFIRIGLGLQLLFLCDPAHRRNGDLFPPFPQEGSLPRTQQVFVTQISLHSPYGLVPRDDIDDDIRRKEQGQPVMNKVQLPSSHKEGRSSRGQREARAQRSQIPAHGEEKKRQCLREESQAIKHEEQGEPEKHNDVAGRGWEAEVFEDEAGSFVWIVGWKNKEEAKTLGLPVLYSGFSAQSSTLPFYCCIPSEKRPSLYCAVWSLSCPGDKLRHLEAIPSISFLHTDSRDKIFDLFRSDRWFDEDPQEIMAISSKAEKSQRSRGVRGRHSQADTETRDNSFHRRSSPANRGLRHSTEMNFNKQIEGHGLGSEMSHTPCLVDIMKQLLSYPVASEVGAAMTARPKDNDMAMNEKRMIERERIYEGFRMAVSQAGYRRPFLRNANQWRTKAEILTLCDQSKSSAAGSDPISDQSADVADHANNLKKKFLDGGASQYRRLEINKFLQLNAGRNRPPRAAAANTDLASWNIYSDTGYLLNNPPDHLP
ncbi:hypothetical protein C8J56DRAFT_879518 [Mycena floridula]|nr:hypothetical protein C8J56DRAFT_879518 [Mycena floridula]